MVFDVCYRPVFSEALLGFRFSSGGFRDFFVILFVGGNPTTTRAESDDDRKIQNQSFAPAYRGQRANPTLLFREFRDIAFLAATRTRRE